MAGSCKKPAPKKPSSNELKVSQMSNNASYMAANVKEPVKSDAAAKKGTKSTVAGGGDAKGPGGSGKQSSMKPPSGGTESPVANKLGPGKSSAAGGGASSDGGQSSDSANHTPFCFADRYQPDINLLPIYILLAVVSLITMATVIFVACYHFRFVGGDVLLEKTGILTNLDMSAGCVKKYGECVFFRQKFLENCKDQYCTSLQLTAKVIESAGWFHLAFETFGDDHNKEKLKIDVPDGMVCRVNKLSGQLGQCFNGKCQAYKGNQTFVLDSTVKGSKGSWTEFKKAEIKCISDTDQEGMKILSNYLVPKCGTDSSCSPSYEFGVRSCSATNQPFTEHQCWPYNRNNNNNKNSLPGDQWPLGIMKSCSGCSKDLSLTCTGNTESKCRSNNTASINEMDFELCCGSSQEVTNLTEYWKGLCVAGRCLPIPKNN